MSEKRIWIAHVKEDKGEAHHLSELLEHQMFEVLNDYFENESKKGTLIAKNQTQMVRRSDIVIALLSFGMDDQELIPQLQEAVASSKPIIGLFLSESAPIAYELKNTNIAELLRSQDHIELHAVNGFRNLLGRIHLLLSPTPLPSITEPPFEAYSGLDPYLFVSYSHKDSSLVYQELNRLHQLNFRIWYDEGIDPGNEWPEEVALALKNCAFFLVFISENSIKSRNVINEINFAIKFLKPVLAIHIEETELPIGLELRIGDIQAILKWRMNEDRYKRQMEKSLFNSLRESSIHLPTMKEDKFLAKKEHKSKGLSNSGTKPKNETFQGEIKSIKTPEISQKENNDKKRKHQIIVEIKERVQEADIIFNEAKNIASFEQGEQKLRFWKQRIIRFLDANFTIDEVNEFTKLKTSLGGAKNIEHLASSFMNHKYFLEGLVEQLEIDTMFPLKHNAEPSGIVVPNVSSFTYRN
jgi:hypothetical protein